MKAIHINPFLNATLNLFEHMLNSKPNVGNKALITNIYSHRWDVSGVIGVTGAAEGVIALRMTQNLVERLMIKTGIECKDEEELKQVTTSMVGEMANVIAGNALGEINQYNLNITVPIVVQGQNHSISWPAKNPIIAIPFMCTQGTFEVNVSLKENVLL
jgi:chemotaxis protein CheX